MTQLLLKEVGQGFEMVEGLLAWRELDKEVDIKPSELKMASTLARSERHLRPDA